MGGRPWTAGDDEFLAANVDRVDEVAPILGRTVPACRARARQLRAARARGRMPRWTTSEDEYIVEHYGAPMSSTCWNWLHSRGRTNAAIASRMRRLRRQGRIGYARPRWGGFDSGEPHVGAYDQERHVEPEQAWTAGEQRRLAALIGQVCEKEGCDATRAIGKLSRDRRWARWLNRHAWGLCGHDAAECLRKAGQMRRTALRARGIDPDGRSVETWDRPRGEGGVLHLFCINGVRTHA